MDATDTNAATTAEADAPDTSTGVDPTTGFATDGKYPINGRLRAEAMARDGVEEDPAGIVSGELIAATRERLEREDAEEVRLAEEEARNTPSSRWTADKLRAHAQGMGLTIETDANKAAILAAIEAATPADQGTEA